MIQCVCCGARVAKTPQIGRKPENKGKCLGCALTTSKGGHK